MSHVAPAPHVLDPQTFPCAPPPSPGKQRIYLLNTSLHDRNKEAIFSAVVTLCARRGAWMALEANDVLALSIDFPEANNLEMALAEMHRHGWLEVYEAHTINGVQRFVDPTPRLAALYAEEDTQI